MSGRNWDRPSFKTRGRTTEAIDGGNVPSEFRTMPRSLPRPKADQRREAEAALREFMKRQPLIEDKPSPSSTDERPPWDE
jgi:hypothetical protein